MSNSNPPVGRYFSAEKPYAYRSHPSVPEELCVCERMPSSLPESRPQYEAWVKFCELTPEQMPHAKVLEAKRKPYALTKRYLLRSVVLPGRRYVSNIITDAQGFSLICEPLGLFDWVLFAGAHYSAAHGMDLEFARGMFRPKALPEPAKQRVNPTWGVGYETGTGLCTILALERPESQRLFLGGQSGGYFVPKL